MQQDASERAIDVQERWVDGGRRRPSHSAGDRLYSERDIAAIAAAIDRDGVFTLHDCVPGAVLERAREVAVDAARSGQGGAILIGPAALRHDALQGLANSPWLSELCRALYLLATGREALQQDLLVVYRCLLGPLGQRQSYQFHYDSHLVTVLVPVVIPTEGRCGDLLMFPNLRPLRRTYPASFVDKAVLCNPLAKRVLRPLADNSLLGAKAVKMKPGNAYVFWGYRSLHCNAACDPDQLRATGLFHYGDPHALSRAGQLAKTLMRRH